MVFWIWSLQLQDDFEGPETLALAWWWLYIASLAALAVLQADPTLLNTLAGHPVLVGGGCALGSNSLLLDTADTALLLEIIDLLSDDFSAIPSGCVWEWVEDWFCYWKHSVSILRIYISHNLKFHNSDRNAWINLLGLTNSCLPLLYNHFFKCSKIHPF